MLEVFDAQLSNLVDNSEVQPDRHAGPQGENNFPSFQVQHSLML